MDKLCIVAAKRTPQGRFLGSLSPLSAIDLALAAGGAALETVGPGVIDQVIVSNCNPAALGPCIARQIGVKLKIPLETPAYSLNMNCAGGILAVIQACHSIRMNEATVVLCGGTESMTNAPYLLDRARQGYRLGNGVLKDSVLDVLIDPVIDEHMALTAERIATRYQIARAEQDAFALGSQTKYAAAQAQGLFDAERVNMKELARDEHPRSDTTLQKLGTLKPAFKADGTVTAGNAAGINDGAAMLVVCAESTAKQRGWVPLAIIHSWATMGCDPEVMGLGPVGVTRKICREQGLGIDAFDTVEINEAFAVQAMACARDLNIDPTKLNPHGGAIALGHPIGASGARLVTHLAHMIHSGHTKRGLATLCAGGGMGAAIALESATS